MSGDGSSGLLWELKNFKLGNRGKICTVSYA